MTFAPKAPPADLAASPGWLCWKLHYAPGQPKPRKVPYYTNGEPRRGTQGTAEDRGLLVTYAEAIAACEAGGYAGVGYALQPDAGFVALDFDNCVDENGRIKKHVEDLCYGTYAEISPSGTGVRAFFKGTLLSRKDVDAQRGPFPIEVFGHNGFVTFTGNVTETCALFGWDDHVEYLTPAVLQMYRERGWDEAAKPLDVASGGALALLQPTLDITIGEVAEALDKLPKDLDYDTWIKVGMATHQQTHGQGFDVWHNWSKQSPKYTSEDYCRARWVSFGKYTGGSHVTFNFVMKLVREHDVVAKYAALDAYKARIKECSNVLMLREKIANEIAFDARVQKMDREDLAQCLRSQLSSLGTKLTMADVRGLLALKAERAPAVDPAADYPDWLKGWVYVAEADRMHHFDHGTTLTQTAFNAMFNVHVPRADGAAANVLKGAAAMALEDYNIPRAARMMYLPWAESQFDGTFKMDGIRYVNTYRPSSVPAPVAEMSASGHRAVELAKRHILMLCGGRIEVANHVIAYLAHCVQKPGVKIRHAILIKGIEGDGKSLIGSMMAAVMGQSNVKQISPKVLGTDFTDWAHGACLAILEEIKLTGHNRYDILNALKPMITNDTIAVHPKGKAEVNVVNTMNYMAFTNHADALPLGDTDRRWFVIFTRWGSREALETALGALHPQAAAGYFDELFKAIAAHPADLRRWLMDFPLDACFDANAAAPMTDEKRQMVSMSASPEEELVREIIAEGADGVGKTILSSTSLQEAAILADSEVVLHTTIVHRVLQKLGWTKLHKRIKWRNRAHTVWVHGEVHSRVQDALDATLNRRPVRTVHTEEGIGGQCEGPQLAQHF